MTIKEIQEKYNLSSDDFWELPAKKGTWLITHQALEMIANKEGIVLDAPVLLGYQPTTKREEGKKEKVKTSWGEKVKEVWEGAVEVVRGEVLLYVVGHLGGRTEWATGEANAKNCTAEYYGAMAEKRAKDRVIIKLINSTDNIYSDVEGVPTGEEKSEELTAEQTAKIEEAKAKLEACTSVDELKTVFAGLGHLISDPSVVEVKDAMKAKLSGE